MIASGCFSRNRPIRFLLLLLLCFCMYSLDATKREKIDVDTYDIKILQALCRAFMQEWNAHGPTTHANNYHHPTSIRQQKRKGEKNIIVSKATHYLHWDCDSLKLHAPFREFTGQKLNRRKSAH